MKGKKIPRVLTTKKVLKILRIRDAMDDQSDPQLAKVSLDSVDGKSRGSEESEPRINKRTANEDDGPEMAAGAPQQRKILKMAPTKSHKKDVSTISTTCSRSFASVTANRGPHPEPSSSRRKSRRCDDDDEDDDDDNDGKEDTTLSGPKRAKRIEDKSSNNAMHCMLRPSMGYVI